jgi:hypothetical protein
MSFNPRTGLVYIPSSMGTSTTYTYNPDFEYKEGARNTGIGRGGPARANAQGGDPVPPPPPEKPIVPPSLGPVREVGRGGVLIAWDPIAQQERWYKSGGGSIGSGTVTTAGNLVFQTLTDGRLMAYTADTGDQLLEIQTGQRSGMGPPMTFSLDGRQYVTLMGGRGAGAATPPPGGGQATTGGGRGNPLQPGPGVPPRVLTFVIDGKTPLPSQP